jgi:hypothetical protein
MYVIGGKSIAATVSKTASQYFLETGASGCKKTIALK